MTFAGINYLAILIAAVVAWLAGAVWYSLLAQAVGRGARQDHGCSSRREQAAHKGTVHAWLPFALAFLAELVMAYVLAGMVGHLGSVTIRSAVISGLFVWAGFMRHHHAGQQRLRGPPLRADRDRCRPLAPVLVIVMGVVIGWMGV